MLVEPLPAVFAQLRDNCRALPGVACVQAACSDRDGRALICIGKDGTCGQMSSLSPDPAIAPNLSPQCCEVTTLTLATLFADYRVPEDFGVLLVDTEGWDLTVLRGLETVRTRPRIIATEDFVSTNLEKYELLGTLGYRYTGSWGSDSIWIGQQQQVDTRGLRFPVFRLPESWKPDGRCAGPARVMFDKHASPGYSLVGWAWSRQNESPQENVIVSLRGLQTGQEDFFQASRIPRPDVAEVFHSPDLLMSGFRAFVDVADGTYDLTVIQQGHGWYTSDCAGHISLPG